MECDALWTVLPRNVVLPTSGLKWGCWKAYSLYWTKIGEILTARAEEWTDGSPGQPCRTTGTGNQREWLDQERETCRPDPEDHLRREILKQEFHWFHGAGTSWKAGSYSAGQEALCFKGTQNSKKSLQWNLHWARWIQSTLWDHV